MNRIKVENYQAIDDRNKYSIKNQYSLYPD